MTGAGLVRRLHEPKQTTRLGWWQIAQGPSSFEELRRQVEAAGGTVEVVEAELQGD